MATVEFRYDPKNTAWFTANAAMVLKAGEPAYHDTTGLFKLGDGVTALSALSFLPTVSASTPTIQQVLTAGQVATTTIETTGFIKTGGLSTQFLKADGSVDSSTYLTTLGTAATSLTTTGSSGASTLIANVLNVPNYTLAGLGGTTLAAVNAQNLSVFAATTSAQLAGVISDETGSGSLVFGTSPTFTTDITTPQITGVSGVNGIRTVTNNIASGAIARGLYHTPTLVASANGDQLTSLDIAPTFTNGAFTSVNNLALTMAMGTASIKMGNLSTTTTLAAIYFNQATPNSTNYTLQGSATSITLNNTSAVNIAINTTPILSANASGAWNANAIAQTAGAVSSFNFTKPNNTGQTASANIAGFLFTTGSRQWANGAITLQEEIRITAPVYSHVSGSNTITAAGTLNVYAPTTSGGFTTITNPFAIISNGNINVIGSLYSTGFRLVDGTQALNKVLISDANGNASWATSSTGYAKSINNIAINTTAGATGNTDYYYFCTATLTLTLPTAVGNTNTYNIKLTSGSLTINTTSSQTIDGSLTITTSILNTSFTVISDGTNWQII